MARSSYRPTVSRWTGRHYWKRGLLRITFCLIVFSLVLISFLLGHYTKVTVHEEEHGFTENRAGHLEEQEWKEKTSQLERKEEQQLVSLDNSPSPLQQPLASTVGFQQDSHQQPYDWTGVDFLFPSNNSAAVEPTEYITHPANDQYTVDEKQWNKRNNISEQNQATISLLSNWAEDSASLSSVTSISQVADNNSTYQEAPQFPSREPSNLKTRNISETVGNHSMVESLETVEWINSSSYDKENLQVAFPSLDSQSQSNVSIPSQEWESLHHFGLVLEPVIASKGSEEDWEIVGVDRCFDICRHAKHETLSDVQVSSIVQYSPENDTHSVLLLFHGCKHSARDWFVLPEEVSVVCEALRRNFSVVAFSSADRWSGCWDSFYPAVGNKDVIRVYQSLQDWIVENFANPIGDSQTSLKLYALGVSSGGSFISIFSTFLRQIVAQAIYISPGNFQSFTLSDWTRYPPTCFVHMERDTAFGSFSNVNRSCNLLKQHKIACDILSLDPLPLTPDVFHRKHPNISFTLSQQFFNLLNTTHWLDSQGYLVRDPRELEYSDVWQTLNDPTVERGWKAFQTSMEEILNRAYGVHEMASDRIHQVLDWFLSQHKT
ncbi:hypothetical protein GpartN1_g6559.t1 [Galdieria partita]|uniref:Uncharacterized protein n=1 Tax=Galdieria partita TaxID=83374 RepID=A0A9C7UTD6_9RHOD|nr:hypothetical protein GpartN1_g6559.t1 [Galdieria partita]